MDWLRVAVPLLVVLTTATVSSAKRTACASRNAAVAARSGAQ